MMTDSEPSLNTQDMFARLKECADGAGINRNDVTLELLQAFDCADYAELKGGLLRTFRFLEANGKKISDVHAAMVMLDPHRDDKPEFSAGKHQEVIRQTLKVRQPYRRHWLDGLYNLASQFEKANQLKEESNVE